MGAASQHYFSFPGRFLEGSSMCSSWVVLAFCYLGQLCAGKRHLSAVSSPFLLLLSLYLFPLCFSCGFFLFCLGCQLFALRPVLGGEFRASNMYSAGILLKYLYCS